MILQILQIVGKKYGNLLNTDIFPSIVRNLIKKKNLQIQRIMNINENIDEILVKSYNFLS